MTDEQRPDEHPDETPSPWWSGPPRDVWEPRSTPEPRPVPEQPAVGPPAAGQPAPPQPAAGGWSGQDDTLSGWNAPDADHRRRTDDTAPVPHDPWATTDTLGHGPRADRSRRAGLLVAAAVAIALAAGVVGGAAGFLLADRNGGSGGTVDGASLGSAPARSLNRPAGSIPTVAAKVLPSVVQIKVDTSQGQATGSGFVIDETGVIVTNNHVVADAQGAVVLTFSDGRSTSAQVVGTSASYDLAVLRIKGKNLPALPLGNSDSIVVGDPVLAIGSPLGLSGTVTSGIISAKNRPVTAGSAQQQNGSGDSSYINALQTDAAINPGNSGGPLVDLDGEVIGVNSAIATLGASLGGESGSIGVGFAIPINQVRRTVEQLLNNGKAKFPVIGASLDGAYQGKGAKIASASTGGNPPLVPGGPAEKAGLQPGDVITAIDGKPVQDSSELIVAIRAKSPGDSVTLTISRNGSQRDVKVTLAAHDG